MRLLHVETLQLTDFSAEKPPKYAILSHCWRHGSNEILYEDVEYSKPQTWRSKKKKAAEKVLKACEVAGNLDYEYIWIDTCCIDKRSSSELSEAINSMFQWYRDAGICLAFLDDVRGLDDLDSSRWFTRGWTLQELIAPDNMYFYNKDWSFIDDRFSMAAELSTISKVSPIVLRHGHNPKLEDWNLHNYHGYSSSCPCGISNIGDDRLRQVLGSISTATIMSWAAHRKTSREEDAAYCLMGLFDINMPLLYGEKGRAFRRLQEEIIRQSSDQSILAWANSNEANDLPSSPAAFRSLDIKKQWFPRDIAFGSPSKPQMSIVKEGLIVDVLLCQFQFAHTTDSTYLGILDCTIGDHPLARPAIILTKQPGSDNIFERNDTRSLAIITPENDPSSSVSSTPMGSIRLPVVTWFGSGECVRRESKYNGIMDISTATVTRITLAREKFREMTYWRRQYTLPPIKLRNIVDCDAGKYDVDYAQPDFHQVYNVAPPCNEEYGLISLEKQGSHRFFVVWGVENLDGQMWCKILTDDQNLVETFAAEKGMGRWGLPGERRSRLNQDLLQLRHEATGDQTDREVLDFGQFSREVLAEMRLHRFLDKAFVELAISVNFPPAGSSPSSE
ncbi:hypothetical protein NUW58_g7771 [Xylaria curta]|uniref:Uncharacterized protein n=1 Tax=Xylaria curta TaxID=42375 RepID=A0ACC1NEU8_9PEZI|nr:hypothetical protein NUW58_g7771 [Xylaria curta]